MVAVSCILASMVRIASLLPAATEIVCALGMRDALVGVSHECDWPPEVVGLRVLTSSALRPQRTSRSIDRDVRQLVADALAVYEIDVDALRAARPDVIITQDLCDVCAVAYSDVCTAVDRVLDHDVHIVNLRPNRLDDIWEDVRRVARALHVESTSHRVLKQLHERVATVAARTARLPRPATLTVEWLDPVMIGGMWMPELVSLAGGRALVTKAGEHAPTLDIEDLRALTPQPDVVIIKPCGFSLNRSVKESSVIEMLVSELSWPRDSVFITDGNAYFNRPGPRIVDSLEMLAACLHQDEFHDFGERYGKQMIRWDHDLP